MGSRLLALLCVGTAALCGVAALCGAAAWGQSPEQKKVDPDKLFQMPEQYTEHPQQFGQLKPQPFIWNKSILRHVIPRPKPDNPEIDPKIILHPPWHSPSKGQSFAHHLYPDLKFLPLQRGPRFPR